MANRIEHLSDQLQKKKRELERLIRKGEQDRNSYHAEATKMKINLARIKEKVKVSERPFHHYTSALGKVQIPSPPSYVLQKQALLCRAMHREGLQSKIFDRMKQECSERIRNSKKRIQDLREESASMELFLLKQVVILNDELLHLRQNSDNKSEDLKKFRQERRLSETKSFVFNRKQNNKLMAIREKCPSLKNSRSKPLEKLSSFIANQRDFISASSLQEIQGTPIFSRKAIRTPVVA